MDIDSDCNDCGASNWSEVDGLQKLYPVTRERDRDKTERRVLVCENCGSEARRFEDGYTGYVRFTGALR